MDFSKSGKAEAQVCTSGGAGEAEDESNAAGEAEQMTVVRWKRLAWSRRRSFLGAWARGSWLVVVLAIHLARPASQALTLSLKRK